MEGGGFFLTRNEFGGGRDGSRGRTELGEGWGGRREERLTGPLPRPHPPPSDVRRAIHAAQEKEFQSRSNRKREDNS